MKEERRRRPEQGGLGESDCFLKDESATCERWTRRMPGQVDVHSKAFLSLFVIKIYTCCAQPANKGAYGYTGACWDSMTNSLCLAKHAYWTLAIAIAKMHSGSALPRLPWFSCHLDPSCHLLHLALAVSFTILSDPSIHSRMEPATGSRDMCLGLTGFVLEPLCRPVHALSGHLISTSF